MATTPALRETKLIITTAQSLFGIQFLLSAIGLTGPYVALGMYIFTIKITFGHKLTGQPTAHDYLVFAFTDFLLGILGTVMWLTIDAYLDAIHGKNFMELAQQSFWINWTFGFVTHLSLFAVCQTPLDLFLAAAAAV